MLENGTKLPIHCFQGMTYGELEISGKTTFSRGFLTFLSIFQESLKVGLKYLQKSLDPLEVVDFPKIASSPLSYPENSGMT